MKGRVSMKQNRAVLCQRLGKICEVSAMIVKCPECGKEVSLTAKCCPHCGYNRIRELDPRYNMQKRKRKTQKIVCGVIMIILVLIIICFL